MTEEKRDSLLFPDEELRRMAAETPPPPEDFRQGWREALRKEMSGAAGGETKGNAAVRSVPAGANWPGAGEAADREEKNAEEKGNAAGKKNIHADRPGREREETPSGARTRSASRRRLSRPWKGLISAAALLVFLVGGTLLTRGRLSPRLQAPAAVLRSNVPAAMDAEEAFKPQSTSLPAGVETIPEAVFETEADEAAEMAGADFEAEEAPAAGEAANEGNLRGGRGRARWGMSLAVKREAHAGEGFTSDAVPAAGAADAVPAQERENRGPLLDFLEDMGAFLRAALPWMLGAAALGGIVTILGRRGKKRSRRDG